MAEILIHEIFPHTSSEDQNQLPRLDVVAIGSFTIAGCRLDKGLHAIQRQMMY